MHEPLAPVILTVEVEINGQQHAYRAALPRRDWDAIKQDPPLRAGYENMLRARLGAAVMERLQPPVTVHMPSDLDEVVAQRAVEELE